MLLAFAIAAAAEVAGPWQGGDYVDLAAAGPDVHAVWLRGKDLYYGSLLAPPVKVASEVESGDGGQIRPQLVLANGVPHVMYTTAAGLFVVSAADGWAAHRVSPPGATGPLLGDLAAGPQGVHAVGLVREGRSSRVFVDGQVVFTGGDDGVCMCCKPTILWDGAEWRVDFRDAEGDAREVRSLRSADGRTWTDAGAATHGGWSPGGCPADGPVRAASALFVSDGRSGRRQVYQVDLRGEVPLATDDPAAQALQPRALPDGSLVVWVEAVPGESRLVARDGPGRPTVLLRTDGRLEPGDPIAVRNEVWVPWQGDSARVERWESQPPPGF
jgi:hypothetical protein